MNSIKTDDICIRRVSLANYYTILCYLIFEYAEHPNASFFGAACSGFLERKMNQGLLFGVYASQKKRLVGYMACDIDFGSAFRYCERKDQDMILRPKHYKHFEIGFLEIFRPYRAQGFGKRALRCLVNLVQQRYPLCTHVTLCPKENAIEFYKKCGFIMDDSEDMMMKILH